MRIPQFHLGSLLLSSPHFSFGSSSTLPSAKNFIRTEVAGSSGKLQKELDLGYFKDLEVFPFFSFFFFVVEILLSRV
jgi:hypothetical protein